MEFEKGGWGGRIRTYGTRYQKALPYRLATPQSKGLFTMQIEKHQEAKIFIHQCNINFLKNFINSMCFFWHLILLDTYSKIRLGLKFSFVIY